MRKKKPSGPNGMFSRKKINDKLNKWQSSVRGKHILKQCIEKKSSIYIFQMRKMNCFVSFSLYFLFGLLYINMCVYLPLVRQSSEENLVHVHLHPGYASLGHGPQPNLSRSIQWELVYYFYVRNYRDRVVTTIPAQITKIYLGVNNIDCTFV